MKTRMALRRSLALLLMAGVLTIHVDAADGKAGPGGLKLPGVCYGPFRDNEDPEAGVFPLPKALEEDVAFLAKLTRAIRTYGATNSPAAIPALCRKYGVDCYPGAWISRDPAANGKELESLVGICNASRGEVKAAIAGNEVLLRRDLTEDEMTQLVKQTKAKVKVPVTVAEIWQVWLRNRKLAGEVDFLTVHIHPYWEGLPVEDAAPHVFKALKQVQEAFPGKRLAIGETGWPSAGKTTGKAVPSPENQARYLKDFIDLAARQQPAVQYFLFEAFDERWKQKFEGQAGAHWGLYGADGTVKRPLVELIPAEAAQGLERPGRSR